MFILDGQSLANIKLQKLKKDVETFRVIYKRSPGLAVILVGNDPASQIYVKNKELACKKAMINSFRYDISNQTIQQDLHSLIQQLNQKQDVDGILLQLPLPNNLNANMALSVISIEKDVDGISALNMGYLWTNNTWVKPCTPHGIIDLLEYYKILLEGTHVVIVGRSNIVGKPLAKLFLDANATVTLCHSKTPNLKNFTKTADIVVVAAGRPRFLGKDDFKQGVVVVDVGIHHSSNNRNSDSDSDNFETRSRFESGFKSQAGSGGSGLCGDVRIEELDGWAKAVTPVPKGVGPMTIAMLLENTLFLSQNRMSSNKDPIY